MTVCCGSVSAFTVAQRVNWKNLLASHVVCKLPQLFLLLTTISLFLHSSLGRTCYCLNREMCSPTIGDCAGGCEPGWYGPGCQVGNLALHKPAHQSTNYSIYTADLAVNGITPRLGDESENNCSHTQENSIEPHWWYVNFSSSKDFVLKNISIVFRQGPQSNFLQEFYILYTRNITGPPNPTTWTVCTYQRYPPSTFITTYTCDATAIGRRVAIYLDTRPWPYKKLMLCEVYVDGYPYVDTVTLRNVHVLRANYGDIITAQLASESVVLINFLVAFINATQGDVQERIIPFVISDGNFSLTIPSMNNETYVVSVAPATCCFGESCLVQSIGVTPFSHEKCVLGQLTDLAIIVDYSVTSPSTNLASPDVTIAASVGGAITCVSLVVMFASILLLKQRRKTKTGKRNAAKEPASVEQNAGHSNEVYSEEEDLTYINTIGMELAEFECYCRNENLILDKFRELRANKVQAHEHGLLHEKKNRFKDVVPYDINRVTLQQGSHDYINASYINGFNRRNKYIATQGPTAATIADFWNMVRQENVTVIVMLTPHVEDSQNKCKPYFPIKDRDKYGILVDVHSSSNFDSHKVTVLKMIIQEEIKTVYHLQFFAWPDRSVPEHTGDLTIFLAKVRKTVYAQRLQQAPIVVHCSAGVGRTGAYIALDYMIDRYLTERRVDMDSCVVGLRDQRMHMVQTKEQYAFIHKALLYGMKTLGFFRDTEDLSNLSENCGTHNDYRLAEEWKCLKVTNDRSTYPCSHYATALLPENASKNRHPEILASEEKRPIIRGLNGSSQTYINAVFCNGCYAKNSFIATQWPMKDTIADFWELIHDCSPECIVLLHNSPSPQEYPAFVPLLGTSIAAGAFKVKCLRSSRDQESGINEHELSVKLILNRVGPKPNSLTVRLVELELFAMDSQVPSDFQHTASSIVYLLPECKQSSHQRPIVVVCKDGASYCGLFLAAANSLHRMMESGHVQVFHTVDVLRASRAHFVNTPAQYNYLYQLLKFYNGTKSAADNT